MERARAEHMHAGAPRNEIKRATSEHARPSTWWQRAHAFVQARVNVSEHARELANLQASMWVCVCARACVCVSAQALKRA
eukprot:4285092-Pleurochrysis_carterae.AAC.1